MRIMQCWDDGDVDDIRLVEILKKHGCQKWLSDDRNNSALSPEDTEWSMTKSTGIKGFNLEGSFPFLLASERKEAISTTAGTPVKSCIKTRAGL